MPEMTDEKEDEMVGKILNDANSEDEGEGDLSHLKLDTFSFEYLKAQSFGNLVVTTTVQPHLNNFNATQNPILTRPPVTKATRPCKLQVCFRFV